MFACAQIAAPPDMCAASSVEIADLDVGRFDARPFGAAPRNQRRRPRARGVERVARNEQLHLLAAREVRPNNRACVVPSACSISTSIGSPR